MYKIVDQINPNIFRGYDLRGLMDKDLDENVYYTLGRAYGAFLAKRRIKESAVGRDNRHNGELYVKAFIQGLNDSGIDTIDLGLSLSQIVYYSSYEFKTKGGAMITASHNPKEFNGLKMSVGYSDTMVSEEIKELQNIAASKQFVNGQGKNRQADITQAYTQQLLKLFSLEKKWKIVLDACNAAGGNFYPEIFRAAGCEVIEQNCQLDADFPLGHPDPTELSVLQRLAQGVLAAKADLGFAFDADGDRMSVVDENGQILWMDTIVSIFAKDVLDFLPGSKIIYNTLCSRQVQETIEQAGGEGVMWLTGHSFIKAKVKEERSPFGGELSGHIFFMDNFYGHDDAAYACLRLLSYLERKKIKLSQAVATLVKYISSPEIKLGLPDEVKFQLIDREISADFKEHWPQAKFTKIDGIRMDMPEQMAIIRASQNGPYVTVKFEAKTEKQYQKLKAELKAILKKYPAVNWGEGSNTKALD
ncbi:MAG: phosphomannomutase/phosphoglucomutase [Candidatus Pacebacteria bacterium]|nr:phosphomannomutase/phosphoglucomutase [Candidatus Paceibacterota bacterium]